jgi:hypothetical protein
MRMSHHPRLLPREVPKGTDVHHLENSLRQNSAIWNHRLPDGTLQTLRLVITSSTNPLLSRSQNGQWFAAGASFALG